MEFANNDGEEENFCFFWIKPLKFLYSSLSKLKRDSSERSIVYRYDTRSKSHIFENWFFLRRDYGESEPEEERFRKDSDLISYYYLNKTPEKESEPKAEFRLLSNLSLFNWFGFGKKTLAQEEKRKQVEELVREYDGSCPSAVPEGCLKFIMLWTGFSAFVSTSFPIAIRGGEKPNWPPVEAVRVVLMFLAVAFYGSLLGLLMVRKSPKLSFYSGYVSLISLLFALGMIAYFTVM